MYIFEQQAHIAIQKFIMCRFAALVSLLELKLKLHACVWERTKKITTDK